MSVTSFPALLRRHEPTEIEPHHFVIEASDLRLPAGYWPNVLATDLGNGRWLRKWWPRPDGGFRYQQDLGCIVVDVLND